MTVDSGLAISSVPSAAPPMMISSAGCISTSNLSVLHQVAAHHGSDDHENSDNGKHVNKSGEKPVFVSSPDPSVPLIGEAGTDSWTNREWGRLELRYTFFCRL